MNGIRKRFLDILALTKDEAQLEAIKLLKENLLADINKLNDARFLLCEITYDVRSLQRKDKIFTEKKEYSKVMSILDRRIEDISTEITNILSSF